MSVTRPVLILGDSHAEAGKAGLAEGGAALCAGAEALRRRAARRGFAGGEAEIVPFNARRTLFERGRSGGNVKVAPAIRAVAPSVCCNCPRRRPRHARTRGGRGSGC